VSISVIEDLMSEYVGECGEDIRELYKKVPAGKRLRAKLVLKIAGESEESIKLASIIELIHAASLLHDDVIDDALTRRGVDSINAIFGNKTAIMLGDILYSKAYEKLVEFDSNISQIVADAVALLSVGELLDVELSKEINLDKDRYFDMIYKKTAVLIEATAKSSALLVGKDANKYATYGKNLGLAFQVIDDVLDVIQNDKTLGKPALNDFKEGKTTLIYIDLIDALSGEDREKVISFFKQELSDSDRQWLLMKVFQTGALKKSIDLAKSLGKEALEAVEGEENQVELQKVIRDMIEREF
jgi:octaprenyl-diphosphate synthase